MITTKRIVVGAIIIAIIFAGIVLWREGYWSGKYKNDMGALNSLKDTETANRKKAEAQITAINSDLAKERKARAEDKVKSDKRIADLLARNVVLSQENETYKNSLAGMTNDKIVSEFDKWLKSREITLMAIGRFSLSRSGAEKSLSLFSDGAAMAEKYSNEYKARIECQEASDKLSLSYEASLDKTNKKYDLKAGELTDCRNSSGAKDQVIGDLKGKIFWKNVETWTERGLIIFLVMKVIGVL